MSKQIRVAVLGAAGRMGQVTCAAIEGAPDMELVARVDLGDDVATVLAETQPDVAVDFTVPSVTEANVMACIAAGVHVVVGATGWDEASMGRVREAQVAKGDETNVLIVPNFSLSAVLTMRFARQAAAFFESVEVIELHHPDKVDAPSGTAAATAKAIAAARKAAGVAPSPDATEAGFEARGMDLDGIRIHAVRLRGLTAHEEVLLGNPGEQLIIRQDSFDRTSFMPGVLLAVRGVGERPGLTFGLEDLLNLD